MIVVQLPAASHVVIDGEHTTSEPHLLFAVYSSKQASKQSNTKPLFHTTVGAAMRSLSGGNGPQEAASTVLHEPGKFTGAGAADFVPPQQAIVQPQRQPTKPSGICTVLPRLCSLLSHTS